MLEQPPKLRAMILQTKAHHVAMIHHGEHQVAKHVESEHLVELILGEVPAFARLLS